MAETARERVEALPCWQGQPRLSPLAGGISNASFKVKDDSGVYVARVGEDFPFHQVFRAREARVSRAAHAAGLSPEVHYTAPGLMVLRFITAQTYAEADVRANAARCVEIVRRCHTDMLKRVTGPASAFWVFQVLRDYAETLKAHGHRHAADLPRWMAVCDKLEAAQLPLPIVFGHHDLLPTNFLDDGRRLWLIDWEYGAFGTAMFDLANIAANAALGRLEEEALLETYFGKRPGEALWRSYDAMKAASALRESVWSMVSELFMQAPGADYVAYAADNLQRFETLLAAFEFKYGKL